MVQAGHGVPEASPTGGLGVEVGEGQTDYLWRRKELSQVPGVLKTDTLK